MFKVKIWLLCSLVLLAACGGQNDALILPTDTMTPTPSRTPGPSPTPRQFQQPSPTATEAATETATLLPEEPTPVVIPDMTDVTFHFATHIEENPRYLQVSLNNWPEDMPENFDVRVGLEVFECEELFPEEYPNRMYCWGISPRHGSAVVLQVFLEGVARSILDVPFRVPYFIRPTETN